MENSQKSLKLMQVLGAKGSGGAELFFIRLMEVFAKQKDVELLCVVREGSWAQKELKAKNIPHKTLPFGGFFDFKTKKQLQQYIEEFKPHVVNGWMNRACKALPKKSSAVKVGRLGGFYALKNYKNCDYLVANTEELRSFLIQKGREKNSTFYIPNFAPLPPENYKHHRSDVLFEYHIPEDVKVLFIAGRLHKVKGIDLALMCLRHLPENVYLLVAGTGQEKDALIKMAHNEGVAHRVRFAGWASRLSVVASAADIWLAPSRQETLGNVVLDAWAHRIPIIASDTQGPSSLIEDGISGLLFPNGDVDVLLKQIKFVLENPEKTKVMTENGEKTLIAAFSENVVVEKYINLYKKISGFSA